MGKHWTKEERVYFRNKVIPLSSYCTGDFKVGSGQTFANLCPMMQRDLDAAGQSRRTYTGDNLFQHYYQKERKGALANGKSCSHLLLPCPAGFSGVLLPNSSQ